MRKMLAGATEKPAGKLVENGCSTGRIGVASCFVAALLLQRYLLCPLLVLLLLQFTAEVLTTLG
jgi:hypothetical protein